MKVIYSLKQILKTNKDMDNTIEAIEELLSVRQNDEALLSAIINCVCHGEFIFEMENYDVCIYLKDKKETFWTGHIVNYPHLYLYVLLSEWDIIFSSEMVSKRVQDFKTNYIEDIRGEYENICNSCDFPKDALINIGYIIDRDYWLNDWKLLFISSNWELIKKEHLELFLDYYALFSNTLESAKVDDIIVHFEDCLLFCRLTDIPSNRNQSFAILLSKLSNLDTSSSVDAHISNPNLQNASSLLVLYKFCQDHKDHYNISADTITSLYTNYLLAYIKEHSNLKQMYSEMWPLVEYMVTESCNSLCEEVVPWFERVVKLTLEREEVTTIRNKTNMAKDILHVAGVRYLSKKEEPLLNNIINKTNEIQRTFLTNYSKERIQTLIDKDILDEKEKELIVKNVCCRFYENNVKNITLDDFAEIVIPLKGPLPEHIEAAMRCLEFITARSWIDVQLFGPDRIRAVQEPEWKERIQEQIRVRLRNSFRDTLLTVIGEKVNHYFVMYGNYKYRDPNEDGESERLDSVLLDRDVYGP